MEEDYLKATNYSAAEDIKRLNFIVNEIHDFFDGQKVKVLDVGCGNGNISKALGAVGHQVLGIDLSIDSIQKASETNTNPNVTFEVRNAEELVIEDGFDVIVCSEVLEHLNTPEVLCKELARILPKNKLLVVTVPNGIGPREFLVTRPVILMNKILGEGVINRTKKVLGYKNATVQSSNPDLTHIQFFTKKSLTNLLTKQQFKCRAFKNANFIEKVFPISLITRNNVKLQELDCQLADRIPTALTSGFYTSWIKN